MRLNVCADDVAVPAALTRPETVSVCAPKSAGVDSVSVIVRLSPEVFSAAEANVPPESA